MRDVWGAPRPEALRAWRRVTLQVITRRETSRRIHSLEVEDESVLARGFGCTRRTVGINVSQGILPRDREKLRRDNVARNRIISWERR